MVCLFLVLFLVYCVVRYPVLLNKKEIETQKENQLQD